MPRFRPRISLLTALLLMTIVGMAIIIVRQWRELTPMRVEVQQLRDQVGILTIGDPEKVHAISIPSDTDGVWKWRIYVPKGQQANIIGRWGRVSTTGYPGGGTQSRVGDGEQVITLTVKKLDPPSNDWIAQIRTPARVSTVSIDASDVYLSGPCTAQNRGIGSKTEAIANDGKLALMRSRVAPSGQSKLLDKDDPLPGFLIWIEQP